MTRQLGTLQRLRPREIWASEAEGFTPWLAEETNIAALGAALGLELEVESTEQGFGSGAFRADILCTDTDTGTKVLIENQLERTDHRHLGQLMTYAAGLHAVTIIWIADQFSDDHRAAMDWLNEITSDEFRFFGVVVEVLQINDSLPAADFRVISKPNDWSRSVARSVREAPATGVKAEHQRFWQALRAQFEESGTRIRPQKASPQHWMNIGVGKAGMKLTALRNTVKQTITVGFETSHEDGKKVFDLLHADRAAIEAELGFEMEWFRLSEKKATAMWYVTEADVSNETDWPKQISWMQDGLERLDAVFRPRVKALNLDEWEPPEEGGDI